MGFYIIPNLLFKNRLRLLNNFPILLGLYGSDFNNIVKIFEYLLSLNKGIIINIRRYKIFITVFIIYYINDFL